MIPAVVHAVRAHSQCVASCEQIESAIDVVAVALEARLADAPDPLLLCVMNGGAWFAADLLRRMSGPIEFGHVHATRYRGGTRGGALHWRTPPPDGLAGRTVIVVDDILDRGDTLRSVMDRCTANGAGSVLGVVLVEKTGIEREVVADLAAIRCPDRYLYGRGLDFHEYWRNLDSIWAVDDDWLASIASN